MKTPRILQITTWTFMILAVVFFWLGLRSREDNVEYTLYAMGMIIIAWVTNYLLRKHEKKEKD